jgi:hypothetical protein
MTAQTDRLITDLESDLNHFDPAVRTNALQGLLALAGQWAVDLAPETEVANMHCHTFFSFNAYGYSPAGLAWLAKRRGYKLMGTVDFDVLDAVDEFLDACALAGVRGSAGLETRVVVPEYVTKEINSPGEPGILYHMGIGFTSRRVPKSVAPILADLRERAARRNRRVIERVNAHLDPVAVDYELDVLPLTPGGNPTERHIVVAYVQAAERLTPYPTAFWAGKLGLSLDEVTALMQDVPKFQNQLRSKLMKQGGAGYVKPEPDSFPRLEDFHRLITACGALPCAAWLDGTSAGEQDYEALLKFLVSKGVVALNIVPDRNWNFADPDVKRARIWNLYEVVELAHKLDLPLNIGTEMNSFGLKLVDSFDAPELAPVRQAFLDGAYFIYGHTALQRRAGLGYQSDWALENLPLRRERNAFYLEAGYRLRPGGGPLALDSSMSPADVLARLS